MYVRLKLAGLLLWVDLMQMSRLLMYKYGLVRVCVRACCTLIDVIRRGTKRTQRKKTESYAAVECLPVSSLQHMATELKSVISGTFYFNIIYLCVCFFFYYIGRSFYTNNCHVYVWYLRTMYWGFTFLYIHIYVWPIYCRYCATAGMNEKSRKFVKK